MRSKWLLSSVSLMLALGGAPCLVAQGLAAQDSSQGETSGPASGKATTPSTAVQKHVSNAQGSTAAGAPGVAGAGGAESGSKPASKQTKSQ